MWRPLVQPYPVSDSVQKQWFTILFMGLFVYLFLTLFRPFGLFELPLSRAHLIFAGYGVICSLVLIFNLIILPELIPGIFIEQKWTVSKQIIFVLWNVSTIGFANAFYSMRYWNYQISWSYILRFQLLTLVVAILPVTLIVMIRQISLLKKNQKIANRISDAMHHKKRLDANNPQKITLTSENNKESISFNATDLLFITSADNYIEIYYLENELLKKKLLRCTLKFARENLRSLTAFYRCHRAWIVNLDRVISITGNSQGYRLIMSHTEMQVPVSRNLNKELTQRIAK